MTIITLPPEIEGALAEAAKRQGTSPELLAIETLRRQFAQPTDTQPSDNGAEGETLYDFLKDYIATIDSSEHIPGGAQMSQDTGQKFAEGMAEKRRQGQL